MAGSRTFRFRTASAGSSSSSSAFRRALGRRTLLSWADFVFERFETLFHERLQGAVDDQVDELLGREEAAAVLARVGVGADDDLACVVAWLSRQADRLAARGAAS